MKIYEPCTKEFDNNGLGQISFIKCIEEKRRSLNGWSIDCQVELKYTELIKKDNIVVVETKEKGRQPFVINNPTITNVISFTANHVVFTSQRYLLDDVRPTNLVADSFLDYVNTRTDTPTPFTVFSDIEQTATRYFVRKNLLEALEDAEETYKGVYDIDGYHIKLFSNLVGNTGEALVYGKNIEGAKVYENWDNVCTKILAVGPDGLLLPEKYIMADVQYSMPYTRTVTFSIDKEKENGVKKTEAELTVELRQLAKKYLDENKYPRMNYTITANIEQNLKIGDIVPVRHPLVNISLDVQAYKYNVGTKKVIAIEYGNYERSVKKLFSEINGKITEVDKKASNFLIDAKEDVYHLMNVEGKNGSVVFRKNEKGVIYEILCMDSDSIDTARTMTRLNSQGIAGTDSGINGQFNTSMMSNGTIVADAIKTGTLRAIRMAGNEIEGGNININNNFIVDKDGNMISRGKNSRFTGLIEGSTLKSAGGYADTEISDGRVKFTYKSDGTTATLRANATMTLPGETPIGNLTLDADFHTAGDIVSSKRISAMEFNTMSDKRLKSNFSRDLDPSWIDDIVVYSFDYKNGLKNQIGIIAQEQVNKDCAKYFLTKNKDGFYSVSYGNIHNALIKYCQELKKRIELLEKKCEVLENG